MEKGTKGEEELNHPRPLKGRSPLTLLRQAQDRLFGEGGEKHRFFVAKAPQNDNLDLETVILSVSEESGFILLKGSLVSTTPGPL